MTSKASENKILRKQKRCQTLITNDTKIPCSNTATNNLVVCNAGLSTGLQYERLLEEVIKYSNVVEIVMLPGKSYCFISCERIEYAEKIYQGLHGHCKLAQNNGVLYLSYCATVPRIENSWNQPIPSGLLLLENFITSLEEEDLLNTIDLKTNPSTAENNVLKHRLVKHFGYEFLYGTNNCDASKPLLEQQIPESCTKLWPRLTKHVSHLAFAEPNQLTVNKYEPGQGIPPHVDTHSSFFDPIISLSLCSDVVMEFRQPATGKHVSVFLPRRSLLIMSQESRYGWTHGITPRKMDVVNKKNCGLSVVKREVRVSLTFRRLKSEPCCCEFHSLCDSFIAKSEGDNVPEPFQLELQNVHKVYDEIANHFSETRHSPWPKVEQFVLSFKAGEILLDIGCGNGKYLSLNENVLKIGCDRSQGLLNVCRSRALNIFKCDCLHIPLKSNSVNGCISIAVIHHLASKERRIQAVQEMTRVLVSGGRALIYVWAKNQELENTKSSYLRQNKRYNKKSNNDDNDELVNNVEYIDGLPVHRNRTQFKQQDMLVPWKLKNHTSDETETFLRFYHVFEENELEEMCQQIDGIEIVECYYDQGNWCVIFQKE